MESSKRSASETASAMVPALQLSRQRRVELAQDLVGRADPAVAPLAAGLRAHTHRQFDRWVLPLVQSCWPAVLSEPFGLKMRLATCNLYASAPYTVLFCSPRRPPFFRLVSTLGVNLPLPLPLLARGGGAAMWLLGRLPQYQREHRRTILIAAFIAVIDHVLDHCLDDPPDERGRKVKGLITGTLRPESNPLRLASALRGAMAAGLAAHERGPFAAAMKTLHAWVDAEVAGMLGLHDPTGLDHRMAGIEGTIDGLLVGLSRYAGPQARAWMIEVSLFVQMLDDWIDLESDLQSARRTPIITGQWSLGHLREAWKATLRGVEALLTRSGLRAPHYRRFVREAYVMMMREVVDGMADRSAD